MTALAAGAPQLLVTFDYDQSRMDGPPFSVTEAEVRALYGSAYDVAPVDSADALAGALRDAASRKQDTREKLHAQGLAYVEFALKHPGRFQMMFANKRLVADDPRLRQASRAALVPLTTQAQRRHEENRRHEHVCGNPR